MVQYELPIAKAAEDPSLRELPPRRGRTALVVFLLLWAAWSGLLGWTRVMNPGLDHGDITTDSNILNAGENFDREGLWSSWGVPSLDTFRSESKVPDHYVTYPPGCYWMHQALKQVGVRELWHFRLVSVFWSSLGVLLFFVLSTRASGAVLPATVAAIAYMFSRPFAEYSDNLHYLSFSQVTLFATLLGWVGIEQTQTSRGRVRWLIFAAAMFMLDSLVTFEHTLFIGAVGIVRIVMTRRWGLLLPLMLLGLVPVGVLAARFAINTAALGSFADVWTALQAKLRQRTGATGSVSWGQLVWELLDRLGWRPARSAAGSDNAMVRIGVLAPAFLAPAFVLTVIALATWHLEGMRAARRATGFALAMLVGGATWFVAMREHAFEHEFTSLLLLPGIAAAVGALVTFGWWQWRLQPRGAPVRTAGLVAGCILLVAHGAQMRHSNVLNLKWQLDDAVHHRNRDIAVFESRFVQARPAFADVERLYMLSHDAQLGRKLDVRFDNEVGKVHTLLAAGEVQMVDWRGAARAMLDSESGSGPPRFIGAPAEHLAFFFSGREGLGAAAGVLSDGSSVTRLWIEPTLDGESRVVGAAVKAANGLGTAGLAMHVRLVGGDGRVLSRQSIPVEQRVAISDQSVVWAFVPVEDESHPTRVEVWFTRAGKGRQAFVAEGTQWPSGAKLLPAGRAIVLESGAAEGEPLPTSDE